MARILVTQPLPAPAPLLLARDALVLGAPQEPEALADALREHQPTVLCSQLSEPIDAVVLDAGLPALRCVSTYAVGTNNIDVTAATARGIVVANTPGVLTDATADMAMALLLAAARRVVEGDRLLRSGGFPGWQPEFMLGLELRDALLGIVGLGRIGQALAHRAMACGMRIAYVPRSTPPPPALAAAQPMPLDELLGTADVISLHVPLTDATRHLIDEAALRRMRPSAVLVNTARGAVIDETALVRALREGWIAAAGLDVYEDEPRLAAGLADCPTAVLAPHLGSATVRTRAAMAELCARNALAVLDGALPPHCVNPQAWDQSTSPG